MKNKKFVATLLHACTLYCVSAYHVQEGCPVAGNDFREYPGQLTSDRWGHEIASGRQADGVAIPIDRQGSGFSPGIRYLLRACSVDKASFLFKPLFSRSLSFSGTAFPQLDIPTCADIPRPVLPCTPLPVRIRFAAPARAEGNATWMEYCLTNGP